MAGIELVVSPSYIGVYYQDVKKNQEFAGRGETFSVVDQDEADRLIKLGAAFAPGDKAPAPEPIGFGDEPPRAGQGASKEAWAEYADKLGLTVPEGSGRDQIIALVDDSRR